MSKNKLSVSVRIDRVTPAHVYCALFCAMVPVETENAHGMRGLAGSLVLRVDEFGPFLERVRPDSLFALDDVALDLLERTSLVGLRVKNEASA